MLIKKMCYYNTGFDVKKRHSQSEIECCPNLPSKLIRDEIDLITKTRAASSSKRSAVNPSGRENVAKKSGGKKARSSTMGFIREVKSVHNDAVKRSMQGP